TAEVALGTLQHPDPWVPLCTVRLLGDDRQVPAGTAARLAAMAVTEPNLEVRNQLASTARRLPAADGLPVVRALALRAEDATDNRQPLLLWWAIESQCEDHREGVLQLFADPEFWRSPLVETELVERTMRRFAQAGTQRDLLTCAQLFDRSPSPESSRRLMKGFEAGFKGRSMAGLPDELVTAMERDGMGSPAFALRRNDPRAVRRALQVVADETAPREERLAFLQVMSEVGVPGAVPALCRAYRGIYQDDALRAAVLGALQNYDDPVIAEVVLGAYPSLGPASLPVAQTLLASRPNWARMLAEAIRHTNTGWTAPPIEPAGFPPGVIRQMKQYRDPGLRELLVSIWPDAGSPTTADMDRMIRDRLAMLRDGAGDPYSGRTLFRNTCGSCHRLFGQGGAVGPELTVYNRTDLESMLLAIVNPSAEIREGFENVSIETRDGRSLSGFLSEQDNRTVVLRGLDNQNVVLSRAEVTELQPAGLSLMPEGLLDSLDAQQTRDLFAYLRSTQPLVGQAPVARAN
ncbi:MAG: c-type cytochrome, partial [Desulfobacterales bacterium]|nr:c-type cytochrome [Desulfobacterales bacterium]